jgi:hypothetical protein
MWQFRLHARLDVSLRRDLHSGACLRDASRVHRSWGNIFSPDTPRCILRNGDRFSTVTSDVCPNRLPPHEPRKSNWDAAGPHHLRINNSPSLHGEQGLPATNAPHAKTPALFRQHHGPRRPANSTSAAERSGRPKASAPSTCSLARLVLPNWLVGVIH